MEWWQYLISIAACASFTLVGWQLRRRTEAQKAAPRFLAFVGDPYERENAQMRWEGAWLTMEAAARHVQPPPGASRCEAEIYDIDRDLWWYWDDDLGKWRPGDDFGGADDWRLGPLAQFFGGRVQ